MAASSSSSSTWVRGKCIGKGSFGTVSLGFDKFTGSVFAVKSVELNSGLPEQIESLENEIRVLRSLDYSPYVVRYLGDDATSGRRNLHLEFLPGGTVADAASITKFGAEEESAVRRHTRCLVSALRHIHSMGIVHCDVKGRNVILDCDGGVAKLIDFGSAVRVDDSATKIAPRGSPLWMAPEVVRGEYQGPESDVWALGCTVIEMVTGKPAWEDCGADTLRQIGCSELPEFPAQLSLHGRDFLDKCLNRDHRKRWTCDQLLQHPFVAPEITIDAPATPILDYSSPRCVLDWDSCGFDDDEEVIDNISLVGSSELAWDRIRTLFSGGGVNWESEGWVEVRNSTRDEDESCCQSEYAELEQEAPGTSSEYCEASRVELEVGTRSEYLNGGGAVAVVEGEWGGPSCQHGAGEGYLAGEETEESILYLYNLCNFVLLSHYLVTAFCRNNNYKMKFFYLVVHMIYTFLFEWQFVFTKACDGTALNAGFIYLRGKEEHSMRGM